MKQIIVNDAIVLEQVQKFKGNTEEFYTGKARVNGKTINVTYDCNKDNLIIHEWYDIKPNALDVVTVLIEASFRRIMAQELYPAAVAIIDRYNRAIGMGFPEDRIEKYHKEMMEMFAIIDNAGLSEDFAEYACIA